MISTTGRKPVIAAPTAIPVKPGSEIGVSRMRSGPNSCTSPVRTLNTEPASAISSPHINTRESRRISSAMASFTASPNVSSRVAVAASGINILVYLVRSRIWSRDSELHSFGNFVFYFFLDRIQLGFVGDVFFNERIAEQRDWIALGLPQLFFLFGSIVLASDVAHMMSVEAIGVANKERRTGARAHTRDNFLRRGINRSDVLSIDVLALDAKTFGAGQN